MKRLIWKSQRSTFARRDDPGPLVQRQPKVNPLAHVPVVQPVTKVNAALDDFEGALTFGRGERH